MQNSNHNSLDLGGINQSCRFNSILNIDEMCLGCLTLAWQGRELRGPREAEGRRVGEQLRGGGGICDSNWWLRSQVESERGSEEAVKSIAVNL